MTTKERALAARKQTQKLVAELSSVYLPRDLQKKFMGLRGVLEKEFNMLTDALDTRLKLEERKILLQQAIQTYLVPRLDSFCQGSQLPRTVPSIFTYSEDTPTTCSYVVLDSIPLPHEWDEEWIQRVSDAGIDFTTM
jgi:hypothetical protein